MRKLFSRMRWVSLVAILLVSACAAVLFAQVFDSERVEQIYDQDLYKEYKSHEVVSLSDLVADFEFQQAMWMPIAPPSTEFPGWTQNASPNPMPFDAAGFPKEFLAGLVPVESDGAIVYPVTVWEDPKTRERVFYNADNREIGSVAAPKGYDPRWCLFGTHPDMETRVWADEYVNELAQIYDPSHLLIRYDLILDDELIKWITMRSIQDAAAQAAIQMAAIEDGGMMLMRLPIADSNIVIQAITCQTNQIGLEIGYPSDFTNRLEIFSCTDLVASVWTLAATNLSTAGTNTIYWTDTDTNSVIRFYAAGNADVDSDSDGLTDAREKYLYHSAPTNRDSDGDGLVDGYSGVVSTNAYPGGAHTNGGIYVEGEMTWGTNPYLFDTDGDGMGDGWEVANGHNPLDPNDPPSVSGTIFYSGRQTGTVWVVAVASSNSWSTNYCKTIAGLGAYQIPNLSGTSYWIKAWMDSNGNGTNNATEAWGAYTNSAIAITNRALGVDVVLNDTDGDSDTLPDWWEVKYFGSTTNSTGVGDPDGDQYTDIEEYQADTDPSDTLSHPWNISGSITYAGLQTGVIHIVACSSDTGWAAAQFTTNAEPGSYTITHLPPGAFYWVKAWRDTNGDGSNTFWEAWGEYANNSVYLGPNVTGVDIALADPDSDGDTLPDWWEVRYGFDPLNGGGNATVAWWKLDETSGTNAADATANANNGLVLNAANAWIMGTVSNALLLDGTNDYVEVPDSASLKPSSGVSVGLWLKPSRTYTNGTAYFLSKQTPGGSTGYSLGYENGALAFTICASGVKTLRFPCALTSDIPVHVAGTFSSASHCLYVNGAMAAGTNYDWGTGFATLAQGTNTLRLGAASGSTPTNFFSGLLDDVRVCDRDLSSNEVHAVYELGADSDGDGLSNFDEYHYGASPTKSDTDADGLLDGWERDHGSDPSVDESSQPSTRLNFQYDGSGWLRVVSGARSESVTLDNEGNVEQLP